MVTKKQPNLFIYKLQVTRELSNSATEKESEKERARLMCDCVEKRLHVTPFVILYLARTMAGHFFNIN